MPFKDQEIPEDTRCANEKCDHMKQTHDEFTDTCDLCSCIEFKPPAGLRPKFVPSPDKKTIYEAICRDCFKSLFPQEKAPPLDFGTQICTRCTEEVICSRVSEKYIEVKMSMSK